jgi:hypothetical protein
MNRHFGSHNAVDSDDSIDRQLTNTARGAEIDDELKRRCSPLAADYFPTHDTVYNNSHLEQQQEPIMGQAVQPAPAANQVHYERRRPEETTLYQVVQEHLESFLAQVQAETGASLPDFVKDEFDAFLEFGILAHGFLRLRCAHEKLVAFSCSSALRFAG